MLSYKPQQFIKRIGLFWFLQDSLGNVTLAIGAHRNGGFLCTNPFSPENPQDEANALLILVFWMGELKQRGKQLVHNHMASQ